MCARGVERHVSLCSACKTSIPLSNSLLFHHYGLGSGSLAFTAWGVDIHDVNASIQNREEEKSSVRARPHPKRAASDVVLCSGVDDPVGRLSRRPSSVPARIVDAEAVNVDGEAVIADGEQQVLSKGSENASILGAWEKAKWVAVGGCIAFVMQSVGTLLWRGNFSGSHSANVLDNVFFREVIVWFCFSLRIW